MISKLDHLMWLNGSQKSNAFCAPFECNCIRTKMDDLFWLFQMKKLVSSFWRVVISELS